MKSTKYQVIMIQMRKSRRDYSECIPKAVQNYVRSKFKCSLYLAKRVTEDLINESKLKKDEVQSS